MTERAQRLISTLKENGGHLTAEELYAAQRAGGLGLSMASVYRILGQLDEEGRIRRIPREHLPDIFDVTRRDHAHTLCPECGAIADIDVPGLEELIYAAVGGTCAGYDLCIKKRCETCAAKSISIKENEE